MFDLIGIATRDFKFKFDIVLDEMPPNSLVKTGQLRHKKPFSKVLMQGQLKLLVTTKELHYCTSSAPLNCERNCLKVENNVKHYVKEVTYVTNCVKEVGYVVNVLAHVVDVEFYTETG